MCNDCRLCSGSQIMTWTSVPTANVFDAATKTPIDFINREKRPEGLHQYRSSEGVYRETCTKCGAQVFWYRVRAEGEPKKVDIATGLVDQDKAGGVRAESWFAWETKVEYPELAVGKGAAKALQEGYQAFVSRN